MDKYLAPEAVEIGRADDVICGSKVIGLWDWLWGDFTLPDQSIIDLTE